MLTDGWQNFKILCQVTADYILLVPEEESFVLPAKTILLKHYTLQINETYTSKSSLNCGFRVLLEGAVLKEILH